MASNRANCDFLFENETYVESVPERFACPICFCPVQRDAQLTYCCGHHFCYECIDKVCKDGKPCPMCKTTSVRIFPNKERQRDIKLLKVHCAVGQESSVKRCEWKGELSKLAQHAWEQHGVTLGGWLDGTGQSAHTSQSIPQGRGASRPTLPQPSASRPTPHLPPVFYPTLHPPPTSHAVPQPPWTPRSSAQPRLILRRIGQTQFQCSPQTCRTSQSPSQPSSRPPPIPTPQAVPQPLSTSQPLTNHSRCTARTQSQKHIPPRCGPVSPCLHSPPSIHSCAYIPTCITFAASPTSQACAKKVSSCQPPTQANEYVHLPEGRILKVYQRKDGSKFYNDHGRRQNVQPHHLVKSAPPTGPIKTVPHQPSTSASEYVHLPEGRVLKVYQRKDGSKYYNDHRRRQNIQPHHMVNFSPAKQTTTPIRCVPCKPATAAKTTASTEYVHLAGGRRLKVYQRKDGSKYYNDHGRRKNL